MAGADPVRVRKSSSPAAAGRAARVGQLHATSARSRPGRRDARARALSWKHIDHPSEVVEVGHEVTVEVLSVELDRERVSLSLKATQEDPWQAFARTHQIGQIVPGKVTKLVPFGAFVRVEEGIEGLVHISELAERHVEIPEQVVQVGDDCMVKVIDIDLDRRRISLSLKQANEGVTPSRRLRPALYVMAASSDTRATTVPGGSTRTGSGSRVRGSAGRVGAQYAEATPAVSAQKQARRGERRGRRGAPRLLPRG